MSKSRRSTMRPTTVERLEDSPGLTELYFFFREFALTADCKHLLCVAADRAERLRRGAQGIPGHCVEACW